MTVAEDPNAHDEDLNPVTTPSGATFWLYTREVHYFTDRSRRYLEDNAFTNVSDLQDVDRMIMLETLCWRWGVWLSQQKDYWHEDVDELALQKQIKETSVELRQLKSALGIDKVTRDKQRGEDSVASYLENLKIRARQFGVVREEMSAKAIELFQQLSALLTLHDNCTEDERQEMHITTDDLLNWVRGTAVVEFEAIDEHFRTNEQKMWIRKQ